MSTVEPNNSHTQRAFWRIILGAVGWSTTIVVVLLLVLGGFLFATYQYALHQAKMFETAETDEEKIVTVVIPSGATGKEIGKILADAGVVWHQGLFYMALRMDEEARTIRSGVYEIPIGLTPRQVLDLLYQGPVRSEMQNTVRLTIPEGLTLAQMAELFDDRDGFWEAVKAPDLRQRVQCPAETLEGFLMPNTYFFDTPPTPRQVIVRMLEQFEKEYANLCAEIPHAKDHDRFRIVTVASLVEEEAKVDEERPLIAAVIYNRLQEDMPLQMDGTLQYALQKYGQRLLDEDKEVDSPYNTYRNKGLPPGPICNPGVASLRAALQPAHVPYRYFVSNADGRTHTFSTTLAEHNRAVGRFRKEIAIQRRALQQQRAEEQPQAVKGHSKPAGKKRKATVQASTTLTEQTAAATP